MLHVKPLLELLAVDVILSAGSIPTALGGLTALEKLFLYGNNLSGKRYRTALRVPCNPRLPTAVVVAVTISREAAYTPKGP